MGGITGFQNFQRRPSSPDPRMVGAQLAQSGPDEAPTGPPPEPDPHQLAADTAWPSAAEAALRAAILRGPGKRIGQGANPPAPYNREQLVRFGLSDEEIELLNLSGGTNA